MPVRLDRLGAIESGRSENDGQAKRCEPAAKTTAKPSDASQSKSKSGVVNVASTIKSANASELRIGMTADEVRMLLGEPEEMVDDEPAEGGRVSNWRYADGRTVRFDHKHHILEVQQQR